MTHSHHHRRRSAKISRRTAAAVQQYSSATSAIIALEYRVKPGFDSQSLSDGDDNNGTAALLCVTLLITLMIGFLLNSSSRMHWIAVLLPTSGLVHLQYLFGFIREHGEHVLPCVCDILAQQLHRQQGALMCPVSRHLQPQRQWQPLIISACQHAADENSCLT